MVQLRHGCKFFNGEYFMLTKVSAFRLDRLRIKSIHDAFIKYMFFVSQHNIYLIIKNTKTPIFAL